MITIYGGEGCIWCVRAKELLIKHNTPCQYIDVHRDDKALEFIVHKGLKTIPQCFDGDKHIGGYEDLKQYLEGK